MNGTDTLGVQPVYTQTIFAPANRPGYTEGAATWTDNSGNFWLFGGFGANGASTNDFLNSLWKYDVALNQWAQITPNTGTVLANYGTQGVAAATNYPGARQNALSWVDASGNLWMFGGLGIGGVNTTAGSLNDLWRYTPSTGLWTWMGGSNTINQAGVYGTIGVPSTTNTPGGRYSGACWRLGNLVYIYGGLGYAASGWGNLGDLWKYDMTTGTWAWLKGVNFTYGAANHGAVNVSSAANTPGSRSASMYWTDISNNLWLSSGSGVWSGFGSCSWGDMWMYNTSTNNWTWVKGSNVPYPSANYGSIGVAAASNDPGTREGAAFWKDNSGDFWMFGGTSFASSNVGEGSDLWRFSTSTNNWTWMKGPNTMFTAGNFGVKLFPTASNNPAYRKNAMTWKDNSGNLWLQGGASFNSSVTPNWQYYADLWKLNLCTTAPGAPAGIVSTTNAACGGNSITLTSGSTSPYLFWVNNATNSVIATGTQVITSFSAGVYTISVLAVNQCSVSGNNPAITLTLFPNPTVAVSSGQMCFGSSFTIIPSGAVNYTYSGSSNNVVSPVNTTSYAVIGANAQGCLSTNTAICTVSVIPTPTVAVNNGSLCPGLTFTMFPTGATNYTFSTGSSIALNVQSSSVYTVIGAYPNGCRDTAYAYLTVYPNPTISVPAGTICAGQSFTLVPSGAQTYTLSSGTAIISPTSTSTYSISGTSSDGCLSPIPAVTTITVHPIPNLLILAPSPTVCNGQLVTFTATGAKYYSWTGGAQGSTLGLTFALGTLTINVAAIDSNGCANTASMNIVATNCDGISELNQTLALKLWPNPVNDLLQIDSESSANITISDMSGRVVLTTFIEEGVSVISTTTLAPGIYLVQLRDTNNRQGQLRITKTP